MQAAGKIFKKQHLAEQGRQLKVSQSSSVFATSAHACFINQTGEHNDSAFPSPALPTS
jgi:hypothetical protein